MANAIDYNALAKQAGAISSAPAPTPSTGVDYAGLARQAGALSSVPPPPPVKPQQPGFVQRLEQSLGLPSTPEEAAAVTPTSIGDAVKSALVASTGFLSPLINYGKTAIKGTLEGKQDVDEAIQNIAQGQPVGANIGKAASGVLHAALQQVPIIGPPTDTAGQDVAQGNYAGAAGGLTGVIGQLFAPKVLEGIRNIPDVLMTEEGQSKLSPKYNFEKPSPVEPPVTPATPQDISFDDAAVRKTVNKDLSPDAVDVLQQAAGDVIPAGSSTDVHLLGAVPEINNTIATEGAKLDGILKNAGPLKASPKVDVLNAINDLKSELPGGTEETFGKAIDKELARIADSLDLTDPTEINQAIRTLDARIKDYNAPEGNLDTPGQAADAARVTIRRALRDTLNTQIPETQPINKILGDNLEVRAALRKKLGSVANDSAAAAEQAQIELAKGQGTQTYQNTLDRVESNRKIAGHLLKYGAGGLGIGTVGLAVLKKLGLIP